jgi:hypothetical protein
MTYEEEATLAEKRHREMIKEIRLSKFGASDTWDFLDDPTLSPLQKLGGAIFYIVGFFIFIAFLYWLRS